MSKELTDDQVREMFRKMNERGSGLRQLADWHARDGAGPVPEAVQKAVKSMRAIPLAVRDDARKRIAKTSD